MTINTKFHVKMDSMDMINLDSNVYFWYYKRLGHKYIYILLNLQFNNISHLDRVQDE